MANMVDMKRAPSAVSNTAVPALDESEYPYGLCISLDREELKKLGLDIDLPDVDDELNIIAVARVKSVSKSDSTSNSSTEVKLQITKLALTEMDSAKHEAREGEAAYGTKSQMRMK